jgi:hypothetical protein
MPANAEGGLTPEERVRRNRIALIVQALVGSYRADAILTASEDPTRGVYRPDEPWKQQVRTVVITVRASVDDALFPPPWTIFTDCLPDNQCMRVFKRDTL